MKSIFQKFCQSFPFLICVFILYSTSPCLQAQAQSDIDIFTELIYKTDSILGSDDELYNGVIYYQGHIGSKGDPFYNSPDWQPASVIINGKTHHQQLAKYNIETDELIVILVQKGETTYPTVLNNSFIDEFELGGHHFVNNKYLNIPDEKMNFLEEVYKGSFLFYTSYNKDFLKIYDSKNPQGKYSKTAIKYYLIDESGVQKLASIKSLIKYLGTDKKAIKSFLKEHNFKYKKATTSELSSLLKYCDILNKTAIK